MLFRSTRIVAVTPATTVPATHDVRVTVTDGSTSNTSANTAADDIVFQAPVPTVTGLSPDHDFQTGGVTVTITGTGFVTGASVKFGANSATSVVLVNATTITATAPSSIIEGVAQVTVTTTGGTSSTDGEIGRAHV